MIDGCFGAVPGVGPSRERQLWTLGISRWGAFPAEGPVLSPAMDVRIRAALPELQALVDRQDWPALATRLPVRDHWRLLPALIDGACFLDIETAWDGRVTVIGCLDAVTGPRLYVRGFNLERFVDEVRPAAWVTFNGASFDLPVLRRTFAGWDAHAPHIDLRTVTAQLGERGGLKAIAARWGLQRPDRVAALTGAEAPALWARFAERGDGEALRTLLIYNLYDIVQLPMLARMAVVRLAARHGDLPGAATAQHLASWASAAEQAIEAEVARVLSASRRIVPDQWYAAERRVLHR